MDVTQLLTPAASGGQRALTILSGYVSRNRPAPASFSDPVWVIVPSHGSDAPYGPLEWPALHGSTLPVAGTPMVLGIDDNGTPHVLWWSGVAVTGGGSSPALVTSLPVSPTDGQEVFYLADNANGVVWRFRYRAASASTHKWEFVGGPGLYSEVVASDTIASGTFVALANAGPSLSLSLAGDYFVETSAILSDSSSGYAVHMSYDIGATPAVDGDGVYIDAPYNNRVAAGRTQRKNDLAAVTLTAKYRADGGAAYAAYAAARSMRVTPIRVG